MSNLNKIQKIVIGIIVAVIVGMICYYVYTKDNQIDFTSSEDLEINQVENNVQMGESTEELYSDKMLLVHISGAVNKEGLVELKLNSRISDAIDKAGGLKENADISGINLAYKLEDGMKIYIPNIEEVKKEQESKQNILESSSNSKDNTQKYITTNANIYEANSESVEQKNNQKININTATQSELETLSGIGPSTALKIIEYRKDNGRFLSIEDIKNVKGIGDAKFNKIKDFIYI